MEKYWQGKTQILGKKLSLSAILRTSDLTRTGLDVVLNST